MILHTLCLTCHHSGTITVQERDTPEQVRRWVWLMCDCQDSFILWTERKTDEQPKKPS